MFRRETLIAAMKASPQGANAPSVQKVVRRLCDLGQAEGVADTLAEALLDIGILGGRVPPPKGVLTASLLEQALQAIKIEVEAYAKTGVLCARGYYPAGKLAMLMAGRWEQQFSSTLRGDPGDTALMDTAHPDYIARSAIAAQKLYFDVFSKLPRTAEGDILLPMKDVEGVCVAAVRLMHAAFNAPDAAVHGFLHGEEPK